MSQSIYPGPSAHWPEEVAQDVAALRSQVAAAGEAPTGYGGVAVEPTEDGWTVVVQLPGVAADELRVNVDPRELRVETVAEEGAGQGFSYRLALPAEVRTDEVDATMDHGLLTVRLPRADGGRQAPTTAGAAADRRPVGTVAVGEVPEA